MQDVLPPLDLNQRYTINEGSAYLRQCRSKTYADIRAGKLAIIKDGRRTYIPGEAIARRCRIAPMDDCVRGTPHADSSRIPFRTPVSREGSDDNISHQTEAQ